MRPVTELSFVLNRILGGEEVFGYHVLNLIIHLLASLALLGIAGRTLGLPPVRERYGPSSPWLALGMALVWAVHPLHTQSVTYLAQRAESLAGLFGLVTLYSVIRGDRSGRPAGWYLAAVMSCLLGVAAKPVAAAVPLLVLLYDRVFLSDSLRQIMRRRRPLYIGFAASWCVLGILLAKLADVHEPSAGFAVQGMAPATYAATQPGVIAHYLKLAFWPHPLVLDYAWPSARTIGSILPGALLVAALVLATRWALRSHPSIGFLGAWFFLTLAPSSSVIPIADFAAEHRMYLPLAGVVALAALGGRALLHRLPCAPWPRSALGGALVIASAAALGCLTFRRNADYRSDVSIWKDVVTKQPRNALGHINLGRALAGRGERESSIAHYFEALRYEPGYAEAHNNVALALLEQGRPAEALAHVSEALRLKPRYAEIHYNAGNLLAKLGRFNEAAGHYAEALRLKPRFAEAHNNWGNVLVLQGEKDAAIAQYARALELSPGYAKARRNVERLTQLTGAE